MVLPRGMVDELAPELLNFILLYGDILPLEENLNIKNAGMNSEFLKVTLARYSDAEYFISLWLNM